MVFERAKWLWGAMQGWLALHGMFIAAATILTRPHAALVCASWLLQFAAVVASLLAYWMVVFALIIYTHINVIFAVKQRKSLEIMFALVKFISLPHVSIYRGVLLMLRGGVEALACSALLLCGVIPVKLMHALKWDNAVGMLALYSELISGWETQAGACCGKAALLCMHFDLHLPRARCSRASGLAAAVMVAPWPHACSGVAVLRVCLAVTLAFTWPAFPETDVDRGVKRILDDWEDAEFAELFEGVVPLDIEPEPDEEVTTLVGETMKLAQRVDDLAENWAIQPSELARSALYLTAALITDECPWCGSNDRLVTRVIGLVLHGRIRAHADGVYEYVGASGGTSRSSRKGRSRLWSEPFIKPRCCARSYWNKMWCGTGTQSSTFRSTLTRMRRAEALSLRWIFEASKSAWRLPVLGDGRREGMQLHQRAAHTQA